MKKVPEYIFMVLYVLTMLTMLVGAVGHAYISYEDDGDIVHKIFAAANFFVFYLGTIYPFQLRYKDKKEAKKPRPKALQPWIPDDRY